MSRPKIQVFGHTALPVITDLHNKIHAGEVFFAMQSSASLGAGSALLMELILDSFEVHLKSIDYYNGLAGLLELLEAPTITDGNSPIVALNRNRNSSKKASLTKIYSNPTAISGGTALESIPFAGNVLSSTVEVTIDNEWVLKPGTKYLIRLTNNGGAGTPAYFKANWYEEASS